MRILWTVVRGVWIAAMAAAPLFGFWLASSLAVYNNASQWLALLVGLALFPILPLSWEAFAQWQRSSKPGKPPILTRLDRLVLRTLIVNALFVGGMLGFARQTALRAVAMRGDWMFDGYDGGAVDTAPLSVGDFVREPMMDPDMGRYGLGLVDPTRAQVSVDGEITITLHNPRGAQVIAFARIDGSNGQGDACDGDATKITCKLGHGEFEIQLYAGERSKSSLDYIGSVLANSR